VEGGEWVEWVGCIGHDHFVWSRLAGFIHCHGFVGGAVAVVKIGCMGAL